MKKTLVILICVILFNHINAVDSKGFMPEKTVLQVEKFDYEGVEIRMLLVEGFKFKWNNTIIYIDPYGIAEYMTPVFEPADFILITHSHTPHNSKPDIYKLIDDETKVVKYSSVDIGETRSYGNLSFEFVPAYNVDKYRPESNTLFHPPEYGWMGVIIDFNGVKVYHAGDTDRIPEMKAVVTDIALLPVSGYAWMTAAEAAGAVEDLKNSSDLEYAIPMHYTATAGTKNDALQFSELAQCNVIILESFYEWYPKHTTTKTKATVSASATNGHSSPGWTFSILPPAILTILMFSKLKLNRKRGNL
ncbi:MAG: MBL fold metallo-hydrolase [Candidatus Heimdallarchaeota archaeon]